MKHGTDMNNNELFELYKKVQQKDQKAEKQLVAEHKKKFPNSCLRGEDIPGSSEHYRQNWHTMYLHLTK